jgi:hypothetical protein
LGLWISNAGEFTRTVERNLASHEQLITDTLGVAVPRRWGKPRLDLVIVHGNDDTAPRQGTDVSGRVQARLSTSAPSTMP